MTGLGVEAGGWAPPGAGSEATAVEAADVLSVVKTGAIGAAAAPELPTVAARGAAAVAPLDGAGVGGTAIGTDASADGLGGAEARGGARAPGGSATAGGAAASPRKDASVSGRSATGDATPTAAFGVSAASVTSGAPGAVAGRGAAGVDAVAGAWTPTGARGVGCVAGVSSPTATSGAGGVGVLTPDDGAAVAVTCGEDELSVAKAVAAGPGGCEALACVGGRRVDPGLPSFAAGSSGADSGAVTDRPGRIPEDFTGVGSGGNGCAADVGEAVLRSAPPDGPAAAAEAAPVVAVGAAGSFLGVSAVGGAKPVARRANVDASAPAPLAFATAGALVGRTRDRLGIDAMAPRFGRVDRACCAKGSRTLQATAAPPACSRAFRFETRF